ncbi:hypothetical protein SAMN05421505_14524 [Sinosporangium album]|uniref:Uncharacterized protein n=1 Tax=Sinosporangium album TaxID=504805 RepID=A0A1G8JVH9_9ACTN|nr:hypothetical protein SAMN05421505_14524 [Sinosporangium album]
MYDEAVRFNVLILDGSMCVVQPYLSQARGVDPHTLLINDSATADGLFPPCRTAWRYAAAQRALAACRLGG